MGVKKVEYVWLFNLNTHDHSKIKLIQIHCAWKVPKKLNASLSYSKLGCLNYAVKQWVYERE